MVKKIVLYIISSPRILFTLLGLNSTILIVYLLYYKELSGKINELVNVINSSTEILKTVETTLDTLTPVKEKVDENVQITIIKTPEQEFDELMMKNPFLVFFYGFFMATLGMYVSYKLWIYTHTYKPTNWEVLMDDFFKTDFIIEERRKIQGDYWVDMVLALTDEHDPWAIHNHPWDHSIDKEDQFFIKSNK